MAIAFGILALVFGIPVALIPLLVEIRNNKKWRRLFILSVGLVLGFAVAEKWRSSAESDYREAELNGRLTQLQQSSDKTHTENGELQKKFDGTFDHSLEKNVPDFFRIETATARYTEPDWNRLMAYRISTRFLLRTVYAKAVSDDEQSIQRMGDALHACGVIGEGTLNDICRVSTWTYYAEWAMGERPSLEQMKQLDAVALRLLQTLTPLTEKQEIQHCPGARSAPPKPSCPLPT